ncbi:hypothetical protein [Escherichia coli]|uniref:hypothetical protein n=1 Tax=Escherichia coli TaxID=562 RepID=UPI0038905E69
MSTLDVQKLKDDAVEWALTHGVAFKESSYSAVHTPFTLTPTPISRKSYQYLKNATGILSKLIYSVSEDHDFVLCDLSHQGRECLLFSPPEHASTNPFIIKACSSITITHYA